MLVPMPDDADKDPKSQIRAVPLEDVRRARGEGRVAMPRSKVAGLRAFRRVRADRTMGAIGILFLLIGVALIFAWEKPPAVEKKFGTEWVIETSEMRTIQGARLAEGAPAAAHDFQLDATNATVIVFSLVWTDDVGDQAIEGDRLQIQVEGPPGTNVTNATRNDTGGQQGGNITIPIRLNGIPDLASVNAGTEEAALAAVGDRTNRTGIGPWKVSVRVLDAPDDIKDNRIRDPNVCRIPSATPVCVPDGGEDYQVLISYATYKLRLKKLF